MDYQAIINEYYKENEPLKRILLIHSQSVAQRALRIVSSHPELKLDRQFVEEGAMLHDIGIFRCDAPRIACYGKEPYIRHGVEGAELMRSLGYPRHARVCERHTGAGITLKEIERRNLPLPHQDFLPETLEEQVICYADKFYSKSHMGRERTIEEAIKSLSKHGEDSVERFREWVKMFE